MQYLIDVVGYCILCFGDFFDGATICVEASQIAFMYKAKLLYHMRLILRFRMEISMGDRMKRIVSLIMIAAMVIGIAPIPVSEAVSQEDCDIVYTIPNRGKFYTQNIDEAFEASYKYSGVHIFVMKDREIDLPQYLSYAALNENTILTVNYGAVLTVNRYNFQVDGRLIINGTVDIEHSEGIMYGKGRVDVVGNAKLYKKTYDVAQKGDVCLQAKDITYGQRLADATITTDKVNWIPSIEGEWSFVDENYIPQAGTRCHDVMFTPKYPMSYEKKVFPKSGQVVTKQAEPKLDHYQKLQIHVGEKLMNYYPEFSFVDELTSREVEGKFTFDHGDEEMYQTGEQEIMGEFAPTDDNYKKVRKCYKVDVLDTEPVVAETPSIRNQGTYGQSLGDINYLPGECKNPYTGKSVEGIWEWCDAKERLSLGKKDYKMIFLPREKGYKRVEIELSVDTLPKVMESINWPTCSDITYGQALADSSLSFSKNEYGTFSWKNENIHPGVKNTGACIVFTPASTDTYDWSRLAGYDPRTKTVTFMIPIQVHALKGEMPTVQAAEIKEGSCLSGSALTIIGMEGKAEWKDPEQVVKKSEWYDAYYIPDDADNYDWSSYLPEEDGRIGVSVYVPVQIMPKDIDSTKVDKIESLQPSEEKNTTIQQNSQTNPRTDSSYVITQLVSRMSTITSRAPVKKVTIKKVMRTGKKAVVSWKKIAGMRYILQYSQNKKMKKCKTITTRKNTITLHGLTKNKTYYVRVRAWKCKNTKKVYGKWSKQKKLSA